MMLKEIGSNFWVNPSMEINEEKLLSAGDLGLVGSDAVFTSSGRAAEGIALDEIGNQLRTIRAVIPSYTCHTVLDPFLARDIPVATYNVGKDLRTKPEQLEEVIVSFGANTVLVHRYFGFDTLADCGEIIDYYRAHGVVFIEDVTQSLFSGFAHLNTDYYTGSLRKWMGMPDGGLLVAKKGRISIRPTKYDVNLMTKKLEASFAKYRYMFENAGDKTKFLRLYAEAESVLNQEKQYYRISPASVTVFFDNDIEQLKSRRRSNYRILLEELKGVECVRPIFDSLDDVVVPLYFPVWTSNRSYVQRILRDADIYAPVVWPLAELMPEICIDAHNLYDHLLCIPIDQRYDQCDMRRIAICLKEAYGNY